jgi:secreted trypsin-like serine protease
VRALPAVIVTLALSLPSVAQAIVGGQPASQPYPHMAQLRLDGDFICGASLVRPTWVLTAAHCVEGDDGEAVDPAKVTIALGRAKLSDPGGEDHQVAEVRKHPDYAGNGHDVALLRLAVPSAQPPVRIVTLGESAAWAPGAAATVTGWGAQHSGGGASDELREVQVTIQSDDSCAMSANAAFGFEPDTMLCAGEALGGRDSCQGDSGGPLTVPDSAGRTALAGVVSSGVGCALPLAYGVYARIGAPLLSEWLDDQLPASTAPAPPPASGDPAPAPPAGTSPKVTVTRRLALRKGRLRVVLRSNVALTHVRVRVVRAGRLVARGTAAELDGRRTLRLEPRRALRKGRYTVAVTGRDGDGRTLRLAALARR